ETIGLQPPEGEPGKDDKDSEAGMDESRPARDSPGQVRVPQRVVVFADHGRNKILGGIGRPSGKLEGIDESILDPASRLPLDGKGDLVLGQPQGPEAPDEPGSHEADRDQKAGSGEDTAPDRQMQGVVQEKDRPEVTERNSDGKAGGLEDEKPFPADSIA